jgi:hypothetical protein
VAIDPTKNTGGEDLIGDSGEEEDAPASEADAERDVLADEDE